MSVCKALFNRGIGVGRCISVQNQYDFPLDDFSCVVGDQHIIEEYESPEIAPPFACSFCPDANQCDLLAVSDENGTVVILDTKYTGQKAWLQCFRAHENAIFDVTWIPGQNKLLTASGDQSVTLWDVETGKVKENFCGHTSSVKSVCTRLSDPAVFASGSRDGNIFLWDTRCSKKDGRFPYVNAIRNGHNFHQPSTTGSAKKRGDRRKSDMNVRQGVTCVLFQDENYLVSSGSKDSTVKVWDIRKNYTRLQDIPVPVYSFPYSGSSTRKHGYTNLVFDSSRMSLFASCTDNTIYQFDCAAYTSKPVHRYTGHLASSFYVKAAVSPDDQFLLSGSSDNDAHIWKIGSPVCRTVASRSMTSVPGTLQPAIPSCMQLKGHEGEVTSVQWAPGDITKLVTLSDDSSFKVWRINRVEGEIPAGHVLGFAEKPPKKTEMEEIEKTTYVESLDNVKSHTSSAKANTPTPSTSASITSFTANLQNSKNMSPRLVSPTLTKWLNGSKTILTSPRKPITPSPRKLVITPKKSPVCYPLSGVKRQHETENEQSAKRICLRKVNENNSQCSENGEEKYPVLQNVDVNSPVKDCKENNEQHDLTSDHTGTLHAKKKLFSDENKSGKSEKTISEKIIQTPTSNLPNSVFDPKPVTPSRQKENSLKKSQDWLTQLQLKKRLSTPKPRTPRTPKLKNLSSSESNDVTPTNSLPGSPSTPQNTRSILNFFTRKNKDKIEL